MNFKIARIKSGFTQAQLSKIAKTSPKKIVEIERGDDSRITKDLMIKLAKALNSDVQTLFFSDEE